MAAAVARHLGLSLEDIAQRAATLEPAEHRLVRRVLPNGVVSIDDAYSANPIGTRQALKVLALHRAQGNNLIVMTSGMVELGPIQDEENHKLGEAIAGTATEVILINDQQTRPVQQGLREAKFPAERMHVVATTTEAIQWMQTHTQSGDAVLIMSDLPDTY
jgi:UDP-N-acetylmuramoyl-tripeptide--D-alanyl-D-alanine ligase